VEGATPAGNYRANWRDAAGKQKAKTFKTKKEARTYLAETETTLSRGTYVDPHAGKVRVSTFATLWQKARSGDELATQARVASVLRTHVLPRWGETPVGKVDHLAVQQWVTDLAGRGLSAASVADCHQVLSSILRTAIRDRLIGTNPCDDVKVPRRRKKDTDGRTITMGQLIDDLLPAVPDRFRAIVALAGGTGMRWGECVGLRWECVDLVNNTVSVVRVAVEIAGTVTTKPFPKSRAGRRTVPLPPFVAELLAAHRDAFRAGAAGEVFTNTAGGPMRRTLFRARVWRPAIARAGLLGRVDRLGHFKFRAAWQDAEGIEWGMEFTTERDAVAHIARVASNGLRFHDLRHSYATWLVSQGVPVNDVREVMGHEQASTTLNLYTHGSNGRTKRVLDAFADFSPTFEAAS